ncbi:MAG: hypothetical protein SNJ74_07400 [Fimbriimonadaceae bacterium]
MPDSHRKRLAERLLSDEELDQAVKEAVRRALIEHKRKRNTVAIWENGKVKIVPAEQIPIPDDNP